MTAMWDTSLPTTGVWEDYGPYSQAGLAVPLYSIQQLFTQQAVIQRDMSVPDTYGADNPPDWQAIATVPCRLYWARSSGVRSAQREYPTAQRLAPVSDGGVIMPLGTDVTEADQIVKVLNTDGSLHIDGVFEIVAVVNQETHMELGVFRPHLGA